MKKLILRIRSLYETVMQTFEVAGMMRAASELQRMGHEKESQAIMKRVREIMASR